MTYHRTGTGVTRNEIAVQAKNRPSATALAGHAKSSAVSRSPRQERNKRNIVQRMTVGVHHESIRKQKNAADSCLVIHSPNVVNVNTSQTIAPAIIPSFSSSVMRLCMVNTFSPVPALCQGGGQ